MEAETLIRPVIEGSGLELVDVFLTRESVGWVVRVTIDRPGPAAKPEESVGIEDCQRVTVRLLGGSVAYT